jgi:YidC/Oxa1 family membrane protein insertase
MFDTLIVQPLFNILTYIYAIIPGHNFGLAIIVFTVLVRFALFPLVKKQLRHTRAMRELQPEIKKIKEKTKGDRQQQSLMMMELYKEREIKPLSFIGLMAVQIVLFLALFSGLNRVVNDPNQIYDFSYSFVQQTETMQELQEDISRFDNTLFGVVDLSRSAIGSEEGFYSLAFILVIASAVVQFFQIRQTMPNEKSARKLRDILQDANKGKEADSSEVNAAVSRNMAFFMPALIFVITLPFPAALPLYWFVGSFVAFLQQGYLLRQDEYMMTSAEVVSKKPLKDSSKNKSGVKVTTYTAGDSKKTSSKKDKNTKTSKKKSTRKPTKKRR